MRIGIMLRHYAQHGGGVKVYTHALLEQFVRHPRGHEFVLFFNDPAVTGRYRDLPHVREVVIPSGPAPYWDQVRLPRAVRREGIDVLYNPKYSIPLVGRCPSAWVCHGLDWYVMPWASRRIDRLSHKYLVPRYAAKARAIVAVSENTREHVMEYLRVPADRVHTIYTGIDDAFRQTLDARTLAAAREHYRLPPRYMLYSGAVYPPKNFARMVRAFAQVGPRLGIPLVIAGGENRFLSEHELQEPQRLGITEWVHWAGWIENTNLPAIYQMAEVLLLPSLFESFGLPILEAMASGCPVLTSDRYGAREIAGDAAVLVNPESVDAIAAGIDRIVTQPELRARLLPLGRARAAQFTWDRCATQTLELLETLAP